MNLTIQVHVENDQRLVLNNTTQQNGLLFDKISFFSISEIKFLNV